MNRRELLRRLAIGASGLVVAESVRDFMAWEARRIFALGEARGPKEWEVRTAAEFQAAIREARDRDVVRVLSDFPITTPLPHAGGRRLLVTNRRVSAAEQFALLDDERRMAVRAGVAPPHTMYTGLRFTTIRSVPLAGGLVDIGQMGPWEDVS